MAAAITREAIVAEARTWLGAPWRHQGWDRRLGCDCIGLVRGLGHALGQFDGADDNPDLAEFLGYSRQPQPELMRRVLMQYFTPLPAPSAALPGDVLWLRFAGDPQHLAILLPGPHIIHALEPARAVVEHRFDERWTRRAVVSWRFAGVV